MSLLVLMGSGETAPVMVPTHREVIGRVSASRLVMLDTPFGFQVNADQLVARTIHYFKESVGATVEVVSWPSSEISAASKNKALSLLARAQWAFCGPGSPTYALSHWNDSDVPAALADVLERGGALVLGSAAAVTAGSHAVPVYEIYKVGMSPRWVDGLDLIRRHTGLNVAVIPHYNNAEGGSYDTRFCYLGEPRLRALEQQLPDEMSVLGVDEHTAVIFDLTAKTLEVKGHGLMTLRRQGRSHTFSAGTMMPIADLAAFVADNAVGAQELLPVPDPPREQLPSATHEQPSLAAEQERLGREFDVALATRDVDRCVTAIVDLEQSIHEWSTDTLQSDESDKARRHLRSMIVQLGELALIGARDPREAVAPFVDAMLQVRSRARDHGDFDSSDMIRDALVAAGVEVNDVPDGTTWSLQR